MKYSSEEIARQQENLLLLGEGIILISHKGGNSYQILWTDGKIVQNLTYTYAVLRGITCRNKEGRNVVSIGGGGYSKADLIASNLREWGNFTHLKICEL